MASQGMAPPPALPVENLTTRTLRMKGVPEADIAAAIGHPGKMQEVLNQYYGHPAMVPPDDNKAFYNRVREAVAVNPPDQASTAGAAASENYLPFGWAGLRLLLR